MPFLHMVMVPHVSSTFMLKWLIQQNNSCHAHTHTACTISDSEKKSTLPSCANEKSISRKYAIHRMTHTISNWHRRFVAIIIIQSRYFRENHHYHASTHFRGNLFGFHFDKQVNLEKLRWKTKNQDKLSFSGKLKSCPLIYVRAHIEYLV